MDLPLSTKVLTDKGILFNVLYWSIPIVVFYLGLIAYLRDKTSSTNRTFLSFSLLVITWAIITPFYMSPSNEFLNLYLARVANALVFWAGPAYYHFCKVFPKKRERLSTSEQLMIGVNMLLALITVFSGAIVTDVETLSWGVNGVSGPGFIFMTLWFGGYIVVSQIVLVTKLKEAKGRIRIQIQYIMMGLLFLAVYLFPINLIYPIITGQSKYDYYGPLGVTFFVGFTYVAIIKHRLMDIRLVVLKSAAYTVLASLLIVAYIFFAYFLKKYVNFSTDIVFIMAFLFALGIQPIRKFLQYHVGKLFSKSQYNFEELLKKISNISSTNLVIDDLSEQLLKTLITEMKIQKAAFVLKDGFQKSEAFNLKKQEVARLFSMAQFNSALVADELEDDDTRKNLMRKLGIEVLVYFSDDGKAIGFLALSEKASGDAYSFQDLKLLEIIAPQITIALKNIEQQQQMIEQIVEERQRINQDAHDHIYNRLGALAKKAEVALESPNDVKPTLELLKDDLRKSVTDLQRIVSGEAEQDSTECLVKEELESIIKDFTNKSNVDLTFNCDSSVTKKLNPQHFWHFQCILEECLNNVHKHSKATEVDVSLTSNNGSIIMQVKDNGVGLAKYKLQTETV